MNLDTLQGYACWTVAAALALTALTIVVLSIVNWVT
jgi:hypothetical protein